MMKETRHYTETVNYEHQRGEGGGTSTTSIVLLTSNILNFLLLLQNMMTSLLKTSVILLTEFLCTASSFFIWIKIWQLLVKAMIPIPFFIYFLFSGWICIPVTQYCHLNLSFCRPLMHFSGIIVGNKTCNNNRLQFLDFFPIFSITESIYLGFFNMVVSQTPGLLNNIKLLRVSVITITNPINHIFYEYRVSKNLNKMIFLENYHENHTNIFQMTINLIILSI